MIPALPEFGPTPPPRRAHCRAAVLAALLPALGCGDGGDLRTGSATRDADTPANPVAAEPALADSVARAADTAGSTATDSITLVFTRDESPAPVRRPVPAGGAGPRAALEQLLRGPTPAERARGIHSWFSDSTAGTLRSVEVDSAGHAVIDFRDLSALIPNASTSAGSRMLLQELDGTVLQFPEIRSVQYRMNGSCEAFWNWLQYECETVTRPADGGREP